MANNLTTPEAILSFVKGLFEPSAATTGGDKKYSVTFVFPKGTDISDLKRAALETAQQKWGAQEVNDGEIKYFSTQHGDFPFLVLPDGTRLRMPWRDHPDDVASKNYSEGSTFINARNDNPPGIVSQIPAEPGSSTPARIVNLNGDVRMADGTVVPGARPVYSGVRGKGLLSVYAYTDGSMGVSFGLQGVQVTGDGERLDGRAKVEDTFEADVDAVDDLSDLQEGEEVPVGGGGDNLDDLIGS